MRYIISIDSLTPYAKISKMITDTYGESDTL